METSKKPRQKLMDFFMPSCEIITHKISESMDHKISIADKIRIRMHLLFCELCTRYRDQLIVLQKMISKYSQDDVAEIEPEKEPRLSDNARKKIIENLNK